MNSHYREKRQYFDKGNTLSYDFRLESLKSLEKAIKDHEEEILSALKKDLNKGPFEAYTSELMIVYEEIRLAKKKLRKWMKKEKVKTPLYLQISTSYIYKEPKGIVLIISPWNYPIQLTLAPLIGAIAAGNCIIIKPSNQSKESSKLINKIIGSAFTKEYISVIEGRGPIITPLIEENRFDHIFFTGSIGVGKEIYKQASEKLTPVTLELGGKSPVIVTSDADIDLAAKKIAWAKLYNCGQTCVAPDYLLVDKNIKSELLEKIKEYFNLFYGSSPKESPDYGRIINEKNFKKLEELLKGCKVIYGGEKDKGERYFSPTLVEIEDPNAPIMKEEIFGPILPIIEYENIKEAIEIIGKNPYPLALYLFTKSRKLEKEITKTIQFGGGCINHLITHVANSNLPFGGIGYSGIGKYHGKYSFDTFTNHKAILKGGKIDPGLMYPPYKKKIFKLVRKYF